MQGEDIWSGFAQRIESVLLFQPLWELQMKRLETYREYPLMEMGMGVLLFMLDHMLRENKAVTYEEIDSFLEESVKEKFQIDMTSEEVVRFRKVLVGEWLQKNGRPHQYSYFDVETQKEKEVSFHLVVHDDFQMTRINTGSNPLRLTPEGIEMLFKTKEMLQELQLSISQLYFKQQMQKGLYDHALYAVNEMYLLVQNDIKKWKQLQQDILSNMLEVAKEQKWKRKLEETRKLAYSERERFQELKQLVDQIRNEEYEKALKGTDGNLQKVWNVERRLADVMGQHDSLFRVEQETEEIQMDATLQLADSLFMDVLNWEREVFHVFAEQPPTLKAMHDILVPLFPLMSASLFAPESMFQAKRVQKKKTDEVQILPEVSEKLIEEKRQEESRLAAEERKRVKRYLQILLLPLETRSSVTLKEVLSRNPDVFKERSWYNFLVDLHQLKPGSWKFPEISELERSVVPLLDSLLAEIGDENPELRKRGEFNIIPYEEMLQTKFGYRVTDAKIEWKGVLE